MTLIQATWRDGSEHEMDAANGAPLMETLRDGGAEVEGTCGGECACGTCHVYVDPSRLAQLPAVGEDETLMLEAVSDLVEVRPNSRLSCQILVSEALAGLKIEVAPAA